MKFFCPQKGRRDTICFREDDAMQLKLEVGLLLLEVLGPTIETAPRPLFSGEEKQDEIEHFLCSRFKMRLSSSETAETTVYHL